LKDSEISDPTQLVSQDLGLYILSYAQNSATSFNKNVTAKFNFSNELRGGKSMGRAGVEIGPAQVGFQVDMGKKEKKNKRGRGGPWRARRARPAWPTWPCSA
jgi:hypothetical protein